MPQVHEPAFHPDRFALGPHPVRIPPQEPAEGFDECIAGHAVRHHGIEIKGLAPVGRRGQLGTCDGPGGEPARREFARLVPGHRVKPSEIRYIMLVSGTITYRCPSAWTEQAP